jgi:hypothetical protein
MIHTIVEAERSTLFQYQPYCTSYCVCRRPSSCLLYRLDGVNRVHHNVGNCGRHAPCDQRHKPCRLCFFRLRSSGRYDCTQTPSKRSLCTSYHVYQAPRLTEPLPNTPAASTLRKRKTNKMEYSGGRIRCCLPTALMDSENKCTQKAHTLPYRRRNNRKNVRKNVRHRTCAVDRRLALPCCGGSPPPECVIQCSALAFCKKPTMIAADAIYTA